jgi:hypothetical protein
VKRFIIAAAAVGAALALTGVATAQDREGASPVYGVNPPTAAPNWADGHPASSPSLTKQQKAEIADAAAAFKLACTEDRAALCQGKSARAMDRCLVYHRLRLTSPCKQALTQLDLAQRGAL